MAESMETFTALLEDFKVLSNHDSSEGYVGRANLLALSGQDSDRGLPRRETAAAEGLEVVLAREHVCDAGQSLPTLAGELLAAGNAQDATMNRRTEALEAAKAELNQEREHLQCLQRDLFATNKSICLAQDMATRTEHQCQELQTELQALVSEIQEMKAERNRQKEEGDRLQRMQVKYREKMQQHKALVEETEQTLAVMKELEELEAQLAALKAKRSSYLQDDGLQVLSGEKHMEIQEQIATVEAARLTLQEENTKTEKRIDLGTERMKQLKTEVEMAKKRHGAQSTRLCRQLQESQLRRRSWVDEARRLQATIAQLQHKVEE